MRTNTLRKLIQKDLKTLVSTYGLASVYYGIVPEDAMYPHIVWAFNGSDITDDNRKDYTVDIDIYTKSPEKAFDVADAVENLFLSKNQPQTSILPTFYLQARINMEDEDKTISHIIIRLVAQMYDHN